MNKKAIGALVISSICIVMMGCKKDDSTAIELAKYQSLYNTSLSQISELNNQVTELAIALSEYGCDNAKIKELAGGIVGTDETGSSVEEDADTDLIVKGILYTYLPSGEKDGYLAINNKIAVSGKLKPALAYNDSSKCKVSLSDTIYIKPNENWVTCINGNDIQMSHDSGIALKMHVYSIAAGSEYYPETAKSEVLVPYLSDITGSEASISSLYCDSSIIGYEGKKTINITRKETTTTKKGKEKVVEKKVPTILRVGVIVTSENYLVYKISYDKTDDVAINEIVANLIQSITITNLENGALNSITYK